MVARYISCDIKINVNIVQNCFRNLAVRGLNYTDPVLSKLSLISITF